MHFYLGESRYSTPLQYDFGFWGHPQGMPLQDMYLKYFDDGRESHGSAPIRAIVSIKSERLFAPRSEYINVVCRGKNK